MAEAVPFNYNTFVATFPVFAGLASQQAELYWNMAASYWRNDGTSPAVTVAEQAILMNLVTAHIAKMLAPEAGGGSGGGLTGRITSASEGSVSVSTEMPAAGSASMAFFAQTQYGLMFWQMTAGYRQGPKYRAPFTRRTDPYSPWGILPYTVPRRY